MAEGEARLTVRAVDKASGPIKGIRGALSALRANFLAVAAATAGLTAFLASSVRAFAEEEEAIKKLDQALRNQGDASKKTREDLAAYAGELQKITTFGDETIIAGQALLTSFGLQGQALKDATKASLDFAVGLGIDLKSAMLLVGKAAAGDTATLSRYGIKIKEGLKESEKFAAVLKELNSRFGGAAQAQAETFSGRIAQLSNRFGDLQEKIGKELLPVLNSWLNLAERAIGVAERLTRANEANLSVDEKAVIMQKEKIANLNREISLLSKSWLPSSEEKRNALLQELALETRLLQETQKRVRANAAAQAEAAAMQKQNTDNRIIQLDAESQKFIDSKRQEVEEFGLTEEQIKLRRQTADVEKLEQLGQTQLAEQLANQTLEEFTDATERKTEEKRKTRMRERVALVGSTLSAIQSLAGSKNKAMATAAKGANIAQALMDTYAGANKALAQGGFFGIAMAALVTAAGLANVAKISSTPLQAGGVVLPRQGGTLATIGEAGRPEAVIPLGDPRARREIGDALGGDTASRVNVTIEAGMIIADNVSVQEFAGMIEEELFKRGRNGKSFLDAA